MALCRTMFVLVAAILCCNPVTALAPTADEHLEAQRWVAAKFEGQPQPASDRSAAALEIRTTREEFRQGHTLRIADQSFPRGIHCPSVGTIDVHLPAPGNRFTAIVGVESNDVAYYSSLGRGQVIASVEVNGKQVFRSPVMHEGLAGVPIDIDLGGATNFVLRISGSNGGTEWDQLDFASARATLTGAQPVDLNDLPIAPLSGNYTPDPPFSFLYGGVNSSQLLKNWSAQRSSREVDAQRVEHTQIYQDAKTGLVVRCVGLQYKDFPTVEWIVYFKNTGTGDTPILEDIEALDTRLERNGDGEFTLHHNKGAPATPNDYEPYETPFRKKLPALRLSGKGGRPSNLEISLIQFGLAR